MPTDPADESAIEAAITAAHSITNGKIDTVDGIIDNIHNTDLPAVKTETAAIKARTDNLPTDPADESLVEAAIAAVKAKTDNLPDLLRV